MKQELPDDLDEEQIQEIIAHYEGQTDEEAAAEDEAAFNDPDSTVVVIPKELMPQVMKLLADYSSKSRPERKSSLKRVAKK